MAQARMKDLQKELVPCLAKILGVAPERNRPHKRHGSSVLQALRELEEQLTDDPFAKI